MARWFKQAVVAGDGIGTHKLVDSSTAFPVVTYVQKWATPVIIDEDYVLVATAVGTAAQTLQAASLTHATLDYPRNLTVVLTVASTGGCTIYGTDYDGNAISETFNYSTDSQTGSKAFATITSVALDARSGSATNIKIGVGNKLGLKRQIVDFQVHGAVDTGSGPVFESTRPTVSYANNTITFNTALNASNTYYAKYDSSDTEA